MWPTFPGTRQLGLGGGYWKPRVITWDPVESLEREGISKQLKTSAKGTAQRAFAF